MKINKGMDLAELQNLMGNNSSINEARQMQKILTQMSDFEDTKDVPETVWIEMLEIAANFERNLS